jgi:hypothetical protein
MKKSRYGGEGRAIVLDVSSIAILLAAVRNLEI